MCVVSNQHKFIFIHIPKNAGGAVRQTLRKATDAEKPSGVKQHVPAVFMRDKLGDEYFQYFSFTVVRNPWDRLWSLYKFMRKRKGVKVVGKSFDEFLLKKNIMHYYCEYQEPVLLTTKKPQLDWLVDEEGKVIVDYICRQEQLKDDFDHVCKTIGMPTPQLFTHIHKTEGVPYTEVYSQDGIDFVKKYHAKDIERFGYTF